MDMTKEYRNVHGIKSGLVMGSAHGAGTVDVCFPEGERLKEETLFYSGWRTVEPLKTVIDFEPYLHGSSIGYHVIGCSPSDVAETVRQAVLARLAADDDVSP